VEKLTQESGSGSIKYELLDLNDLDNVVEFSNRLRKELGEKKIVLILNAGVMAVDRGTTANGFEKHFGVNHLAHFVLTNRLISHLNRVVSVSSIASRQASSSIGSDWEEWALLHDSDWGAKSAFFWFFTTWMHYSASKAANIAFALGVAAKYPSVEAVAIQPGYTRTALQENTIFSFLNSFKSISMESIEGALIQVRAATDPKIDLKASEWYAPSDGLVGHPAIVDNELPVHVTEKESVENLWRVSEKLTAKWLK
jgi:NAD(P)-dependent dehydrogenase (short-subunit alcohol dehydrogenase family)